MLNAIDVLVRFKIIKVLLLAKINRIHLENNVQNNIK
jgi:hypothetical protein